MTTQAMLRVAALVLVISMGLGWYVEVRSDAMHERYRLTSAALERMLHRSAALSSLLSISVLEQNILHVGSYETVHTELEGTFKEVTQLTHGLTLASEISSLHEASAALRRSEQGALALMQADAWDDARKILFDNEYVLSRKMYEINSETAVGVLSGELADQVDSLNWLRQGMLGLRVFAVMLLLWVGNRYSKRLHAELAEQGRLRQALLQSNEDLEAKVHERTHQLEQANVQLARLSTTDALTGIPNRRSLDEVLAREWMRAQRTGSALAVALMDVDWFKNYNDHYGHPAGDVCLQAVAQALDSTVTRSGDFVARYGGEEFIFIAPGTDEAGAAQLAKRILRAVRHLHIPHVLSPLGEVSISIGVAACVPGERTHEGPDALLQQADEALYQAKQAGRDRIVCAATGRVLLPPKESQPSHSVSL